MSNTRLTSSEKSYGWVGVVVGVVACRIILSAQVPVPFHWTLDFRLWTWIWDLGLGLGLDNIRQW